MPRIHVLASARRDLADLHVYFALESPALAERFIAAVRETSEFLAAHPRIGRHWSPRDETLESIRVWRVAGFPRILLFYRHVGGGIVVLHVMHGSRDLDSRIGFSPED